MDKFFPYILWWIFTFLLIVNYLGLNPYSKNSRSTLMLMAWFMGSTLMWVSSYIKKNPAMLKSILKTMLLFVVMLTFAPPLIGMLLQTLPGHGSLPPAIFLPLSVWVHIRNYPLDPLTWLYILTALIIGIQQLWRWWRRGSRASYDR